MDELLLNFLGREREKTVRIGERTCAMRLLSARETLSLRREIAQLDCAGEEERALRANAALLKRSLTEGGEAAFASAEDVENALSVGEINELVRCYALLDGAENPSSEDGREKVEALKKHGARALRTAEMARAPICRRAAERKARAGDDGRGLPLLSCARDARPRGGDGAAVPRVPDARGGGTVQHLRRKARRNRRRRQREL